MFNAVRQNAQKSIMTVSSWYRIPVKGMDRYELLAMSSCLPLKASPRYEYKYHFVCPFHVVAPYLFKAYFPDATYPWLQYVTEENVLLTAEFRDNNGNITNRIGVHNKVIAHDWHDLCCFHLHKEEEALITLKMYGMDRNPQLFETEAYPNTFEGMTKLVSDTKSRVELKDTKPSPHRLRKENEPFNTVNACSFEEDFPKKGEPLLLAGYRREIRQDKDGRDDSLMIPFSSEGRAIRIDRGRSFVTSNVQLPAGILGGGAFDMNGNCKGMIEGVVHKPGTNINGHIVRDTHAQNIYENCAAIINADMLSDFVANVELGLLDDMQDEVRKLRKQMGEEAIKEEQQKILKPMMEAIENQS